MRAAHVSFLCRSSSSCQGRALSSSRVMASAGTSLGSCQVSCCSNGCDVWNCGWLRCITIRLILKYQKAKQSAAIPPTPPTTPPTISPVLKDADVGAGIEVEVEDDAGAGVRGELEEEDKV